MSDFEQAKDVERIAWLQVVKQDLDRTVEYLERNEANLRQLRLVIRQHFPGLSNDLHLELLELKERVSPTGDAFFEKLAEVYIGETELMVAIRSNTKRMRELFFNLTGAAVMANFENYIPEG